MFKGSPWLVTNSLSDSVTGNKIRSRLTAVNRSPYGMALKVNVVSRTTPYSHRELGTKVRKKKYDVKSAIVAVAPFQIALSPIEQNGPKSQGEFSRKPFLLRRTLLHPSHYKSKGDEGIELSVVFVLQ